VANPSTAYMLCLLGQSPPPSDGGFGFSTDSIGDPPTKAPTAIQNKNGSWIRSDTIIAVYADLYDVKVRCDPAIGIVSMVISTWATNDEAQRAVTVLATTLWGRG